MNETKRFPLDEVLSIVPGNLVAVRHMDAVYDILNWMTNDSLFTHQLPRAGRECEPWLLRWFPELSDAVAMQPELERSLEGKSREECPAPRPAAAPLKPAKPAASTASDDEAAPRRQGRPSHADRIADVLKQRGKLAARDIAKALGLSEESARHHLQNDERFDVDGVGLWELS